MSFLMFMLALLGAGDAAPQPPAAAGAAVFESKCASCHTNVEGRTPSVAALRQRTPAAILEALTTGPMRQQGAELTDVERRAVADYLGTKSEPPSASAPAPDPTAGRCTTTGPFDPSGGPRWTGW